MSDYNVQDNATLHMVTRLRGGEYRNQENKSLMPGAWYALVETNAPNFLNATATKSSVPGAPPPKRQLSATSSVSIEPASDALDNAQLASLASQPSCGLLQERHVHASLLWCAKNETTGDRFPPLVCR